MLNTLLVARRLKKRIIRTCTLKLVMVGAI